MLRSQFVDLVRLGGVGVSEACRRHGISRDTGARSVRIGGCSAYKQRPPAAPMPNDQDRAVSPLDSRSLRVE
jgi:hypothetical protein